MGLLDALFSGGGSSGGLLDFLRNNALNQNTNTGIGSDNAGYAQAGAPSPVASMSGQPSPIFAPQNAPSPLDGAQWPAGPVGAPLQANAQMPAPQPVPAVIPAQPQPMAPQGAPPTGPDAAQPGFLDKLNAGLQSMGHGGSLIGALTGNLTDPTSIAKTQQNQASNVTMQALKLKGVDPSISQAAILQAAAGNREPLNKLWEATFGPQAVTSIGDGYVADKKGNITRAYTPDKTPLSIGNGYIYDPVAKKTIHAYEAEDKIPAGFAKGDDGNMHFIPGGPADPAYLRLAEAQKKDPNGNYVLGRGGEVVKNNPDGTITVLHKNESEAPVPMDPASLEILARREVGGDFSGRKNLGRGAQGAADLKAITNKSSEILTKEMGLSASDAAAHLLKKQQEFNAQGQGLNAEARTTGVREANLNLILKAADAAIPAALEASEKVSRTGFVPLNKIIQHGEIMTSDPALKSFGMANLQLAEHWARAMNPTGVMRESDRDKALSFLSTADSKETYRTAVGQLRTQIERERDAVKSSRGMSDLPGAGGPSTPKGPVKIDGYTITEH